MIILDASVLIAHLWPSDAHHGPATALLLDGAGEDLLVHALTLAEVLVGGVRIGRGAEMRADLLAISIRLPERDEGEPLRFAELRVTTGLKLPDCCVLDAAVTSGARLATFDAALAASAAQLGVPVLPRLPGG